MGKARRTLSIIFLALLVATLIATPVLASPAFATRALPSSVASGSEFDVAIEAGGCGAFGQVVETLPDGFTYLHCSSGDIGVEQTGNVVKFSFLGDAVNFAYTVRAPRVAATTAFTFQGKVLDEDRVSYPIEDDEVIVLVSSGIRTLPTVVASGVEFDVAIEASGCGAFGQVVETLPGGFTYVSSSLPEEQVEQIGNMVKFSFLGDAVNFTYMVESPEVTAGAAYTFRGKVLDEDRISYPIEDDDITVMSPPVQVRTATGTGIAAFSSSLGNVANLVAVSERTLPAAGKPEGFTFPHGLFSFDIVGIGPGATVTVALALPSAVSTGTLYWKYDAPEGWVEVTSLLGDDDGDNELTLTLTDGGPGDADGEANGTIVEPGGPALVGEKQEVHKTYVLLPEPADFSSSYLYISPQQVMPDQQVEISVNIANHGGEKGDHTASLYIDGNLVDSQTVGVSPGACQSVVFRVSEAIPGTYHVYLEGQQGQFTVIAPAATTCFAGGLGTGGIVAIAVVALMLIAALVFLFARTKRE